MSTREIERRRWGVADGGGARAADDAMRQERRELFITSTNFPMRSNLCF